MNFVVYQKLHTVIIIELHTVRGTFPSNNLQFIQETLDRFYSTASIDFLFFEICLACKDIFSSQSTDILKTSEAFYRLARMQVRELGPRD